jgi:hypothetical protein
VLNDELVDEVKRRLPLSLYLNVRVQGYAACPYGDCPSHDKNKQKAQVFHESFKCYVCGRGGDIFTWVQADRDCGFAEALRLVAGTAGVSLVPDRTRSALLQKVVSAASRYLFRHPDLEAYLTQKRGLARGLLFRYQVGYIDVEGQVLRDSGLTGRELLQLGFLKKPRVPGERFESRMAGRFLFPIRDDAGRVVQVKGRQNPALDWGDDDAKSKPLPKRPPDAPGGWGTVSHHDYLVLEEELYEARRRGFATLWEGEPDTYTARALGLPAFGLQGSEGLYKHAFKLKGVPKLYVGLDNDVATEMKLVKELLRLQLALPGTEIRRLRFPTLGRDFAGKPLKLDANDYVVVHGAGRPEFEALMAESVLAQDLILAELGPKYDTDLVQNDLKRLFRATPVAYQARFITHLAAVTGYPEHMLAFGLDPRCFRESPLTLHA